MLPMARRARILLIAAAVVAFLVISAALARILSANGAERSAVVALVRAEAHGDLRAATATISSCADSVACQKTVRDAVAAVPLAGRIEVLSYEPSTGFSFGGSRGTGRIAWRTAPAGRPVVQCVGVRRTGDPVSGLGVSLTSVTRPIRTDASCAKG
jgi:hypothetical protein